MKTNLTIVIASLVLLPAVSCLAARNADLKPIFAKPGKELAEEKFGGALGKNWNVAKGDWQPRDGMLVGREKPEDKHAAVCLLAVPNHDSIIRFSFKFDGSKSFALSYNHAKGHLFRVSLTPASVTVGLDKDKKDESSKAVQLGKAGAKFEPGQWYTMQVEVKGDKVAVQTDNGVKIEGSNAALNADKTGYRFVTAGESVAIADLKAWDVAP